jgi:L-cystine transport system permease protein
VYKTIDPVRVLEDLPIIASGILNTMFIVILASALGIAVGLLLAMARVNRVPVLNQLAVVYGSFMRGTPVIVQLFIVYYGLPILFKQFNINLARMAKINFVIVAYGLNTSAVYSEIFRGALSGVPIGQLEAACSVGLTRWQAFRRIIAPQAFLSALPGISSCVIGLIENTSLAFTIGVVDIMGKVKVIGSATEHYMEAYICAAIYFIAMSLILRRVFSAAEKALQSRVSGIGSAA